MLPSAHEHSLLDVIISFSIHSMANLRPSQPFSGKQALKNHSSTSVMRVSHSAAADTWGPKTHATSLLLVLRGIESSPAGLSNLFPYNSQLNILLWLYASLQVSCGHCTLPHVAVPCLLLGIMEPCSCLQMGYLLSEACSSSTCERLNGSSCSVNLFVTSICWLSKVICNC